MLLPLFDVFWDRLEAIAIALILSKVQVAVCVRQTSLIKDISLNLQLS